MNKWDGKELAYHKIEKTKTLKIRNRYTRLNGKNSFRGEHGYGEEFLVKVLVTDQGACGWGYTSGSPYHPPKEKDDLLLGKSVAELFSPDEGILEETYRDYDFALHDLAGKILNVPVFRMLGGEGENPVSCYDGAILMDDLSPDGKPGGLGAILEECEKDYELGYRDFKLKIGRAPKWMGWKEGLKRDIEVTRMVRTFYPDARIMVDANSAYPVEKMEAFIDAVSDCHLYWIEEPFVENREDNRRLREYLNDKMPGTWIADGEADPDVPMLLSMAEEGILDVIQMDTAGYGFTKWRRLLPVLKEKRIKISPHNWGLKLKTHYCAAIAAAYADTPSIEGVLDETEGVDFSAYRLKEGKLIVPDSPGFGMELIWGDEL